MPLTSSWRTFGRHLRKRSRFCCCAPQPPTRFSHPLENNERPTVDICAGFDDDDVYLQTIDGLPLVTVAKRQDAKSVSVAAGRDNKSVIVFLSDGTNVRQLEVSGITKMMAFDCGSFELK